MKPGGILIYSTCTYNTKEDEENVHWIQQEFGAEPLALEIREDWNITGNLLYKGSDDSKAVGNSEQKAPVYHFFPHKTKGEGFFLAVLRKPETEEDTMPAFSSSKSKAAKRKDKKGGATPSLVSKEHLNIAKNWLNEEKLPGYIVSVEGTKIQVFPQQYVDELAAMKQSLKIVSAGVGIGEVKGKDLIPGHALAMSSVLLRQGVFATEDITYEQAIAIYGKRLLPCRQQPLAVIFYLLTGIFLSVS